MAYLRPVAHGGRNTPACIIIPIIYRKTTESGPKYPFDLKDAMSTFNTYNDLCKSGKNWKKTPLLLFTIVLGPKSCIFQLSMLSCVTEILNIGTTVRYRVVHGPPTNYYLPTGSFSFSSRCTGSCSQV